MKIGKSIINGTYLKYGVKNGLKEWQRTRLYEKDD